MGFRIKRSRKGILSCREDDLLSKGESTGSVEKKELKGAIREGR